MEAEALASGGEENALIREWWLSNAYILRCIAEKAQRGEKIEPFPVTLVIQLAKISEDLAGGNIHKVIHGAKKKGSLSLGERECVAVAVRYKSAAEAGIIDDKRHTKTVCEAFGVHAQAVQKWMKQRDKRLLGVFDPRLSPDQLRDELIRAGEAYQKWGYYGTDKE